jgi:uncharacterized protein (TIGR02391 family)
MSGATRDVLLRLQSPLATSGFSESLLASSKLASSVLATSALSKGFSPRFRPGPSLPLSTKLRKNPLGIRRFGTGLSPEISRPTEIDLDPSRDDSPHVTTSEHLWQFDLAIMDEGLRQTCRRLFCNGHYVEAVERAFIYVNNKVKQKSGLTDKDGADLMRAAFSANSPVLMLNEFQSESHKNEQRGYMEIFAGAMAGIRNPRAHEHDLVDSPDVALELLVIANHLMRRTNESKTAG